MYNNQGKRQNIKSFGWFVHISNTLTFKNQNILVVIQGVLI
jgi:hypothetical protein